MNCMHILDLYKNAFVKIHNYQNMDDYQFKNTNLEEVIPFYRDDKKYYDDIEACYHKWLEENQIQIEEELLQKLEAVYSIWEDEESKGAFDWYIQFRLTYTILHDTKAAETIFPYPMKYTRFQLARMAASQIQKEDDLFVIKGYKMETDSYLVSESWICETYVLEDKCGPDKNDVIIDAGAYKGETALWFADKVGKNGKVYAFEILPSHVQVIEQNIHRNGLDDIVSTVNKGLWSENSTIQVCENSDATKCSETNEGIESEVVAFDDFVEEMSINKIDYIKMDIEGAELNALKGAEKTLKRDQPKLAICLYHKYMDIVEIPLWLKQLNSQYKFYIAQKTPSPNSIVMYVK